MSLQPLIRACSRCALVQFGFLLLCFGFAAGSSAATLVWDANTEPDLAGYNVYIAQDGEPATVKDAGLATSLPLNDLVPGETWVIYVTAYNTSGIESDPSESVVWTVPENGITYPPVISIQPLSQSIPLAGTVTLSVHAAGTKPLSFLWFKDGVVVPGATNPVLNMENVQPADAGTYHVEISNSAGRAVSSPAVLSLLPEALPEPELRLSARPIQVNSETPAVLVTVEGPTGRYEVQYAESLHAESWTTVGEVVISYAGVATLYDLPGAIRFYRVLPVADPEF